MLPKEGTGNRESGNWNEFTVIIHMRSQMEEKGKEKALLRAFKFTGKQNLILNILSYFDFSFLKFYQINVTCICKCWLSEKHTIC